MFFLYGGGGQLYESEVIGVANNVRAGMLAFACMELSILTLGNLACLNQLRQDAICTDVVVALELHAAQLLLELGDALLLLLHHGLAQLFRVVLALDVGLLPSALGPDLEKMGTHAA